MWTIVYVFCERWDILGFVMLMCEVSNGSPDKFLAINGMTITSF
jgi:hypothetical protein